MVVGDAISLALCGAAVFCVLLNHGFGPRSAEEPRARGCGTGDVRNRDNIPNADRSHVQRNEEYASEWKSEDP